MFPAPDRSDGDGAAGLGTKLNVTPEAEELS
jgi:hypothetical protein